MHIATTTRRSALATLAAAVLIVSSTTGIKGQARNPVNETEVDGTLEVQYEDYDGGARLRHFLDTPAGRLELSFPSNPPEVPSGSRVRARGRLTNGMLMLTGTSSGSSLQTLALASPNTFGVQQTLVMLINFQDNATQPYTLAAAQSVTFQQTSGYYLENTYQQTSLAGTVVGWYTIAATSTTCDTGTWASLADQAATNAGVNVAAFTRRVYGFPQTNACSWWGLGTVGGNPSRAWINGSYTLKVVGHEMGHNFGAYHSHSAPCDSTGCTSVEYGDDRDIMGQSASGHMTAFQKERLGWLNYGSSPPVQTVATPNNYWVEALGTPSTGTPKALKILKSTDSSGYRTWYYVEARAKLGADGSIAPGVVIHTGSESSGSSSYETDLQPSTTTWDSTLDLNQSFTDPAIGLTIATVTADNTGALVGVTFGTIPCAAAQPAVTLASSSFMKYLVTVTNTDGSSCGASPFSFSAAVPTGWTASFNPAIVSSLAPGSSASSTLTLTAPSGTSGMYSFGVNATNGTSGFSGSATASVMLAASLDLTTTATLSGSGNNRSATIRASVKIGQSPVTGAAVTVAVTKPGGATTMLSTTTAADGSASVKFSLKPKDPSGVYQVLTTANSNGGSGTSTTSFTVQ